MPLFSVKLLYSLGCCRTSADNQDAEAQGLPGRGVLTHVSVNVLRSELRESLCFLVFCVSIVSILLICAPGS